MPLRTEQMNNDVVIHLSEKFDFSSSEEFKEAYGAENVEGFTIDFRETNYMDSSGLGMLLNMKRSTGGRPIALVNCKPQIKKVLVISRFDEHFTIN